MLRVVILTMPHEAARGSMTKLAPHLKSLMLFYLNPLVVALQENMVLVMSI